MTPGITTKELAPAADQTLFRVESYLAKTIVTLVFVFSFALSALAQDNPHQINATAGASFAIGNFGDETITNQNAGNAGTGINLSLNYKYQFLQNLGFGAKVFGNTNALDMDSLIKVTNQQTGLVWSGEATDWTAAGVLLGITAHVSQSDNFILDFQILIGYIHMDSPEVRYTIANNWLEQQSQSSGAFGYSFGMGFTYNFNPRLSLLLDIDYLAADFDFDRITASSSFAEVQVIEDVKQSFSVVAVNLGFGFNF